MEIFYYKDDRLSYANRNRFINIPVSHFNKETQKKVLLNDGARTFIKTSINNLCDYVLMIDKNNNKYRWFVVRYEYLNNEQVILYLQRDVVGEKGINVLQSSFGKIERGFTETILRNRKELSLNQQLQKRIPLKSSTNTHGNFIIEPESGAEEAWGIVYFVKPKRDEVPGNEFNIEIPDFVPTYNENVSVNENTKYVLNETISKKFYQSFTLSFSGLFNEYIKYYVYIEFDYDFINHKYFVVNTEFRKIDGVRYLSDKDINFVDILVKFSYNIGFTFSDYEKYCNGFLTNFLDYYCNRILNGETVSYVLPDLSSLVFSSNNYSGTNIKRNVGGINKYYKILGTEQFEKIGNNYLFNNLEQSKKNNEVCSIINSQEFLSIMKRESGFNANVIYNGGSSASGLTYKYIEYVFSEIENIEGTITIDLEKSLIDEPYYILVFPLFNCKIKDKNNVLLYNINKDNAFKIFNETISFLSGENPYIVDAQIVPYCPELNSVSCVLKDLNEVDKYPLFDLIKNYFEIDCNVSADDLGVDFDVKKEYIKKHYSIISPEKTGKFDFNYYDYFVSRKDFSITIKVALKPFAVIASAVIKRDNESIVGIKFDTDLNGSQPSSNGFECSLSSNAFETYRRQNANYQQIFALQQQEMQKQHEVERVNEKVSGVVNTLSIGAMGAIAGGSLGGGVGIGTAAGAAVGAAAASATVGVAMATQYQINEELRNYEERLLKERFELDIGTIKAIPNSINRISSFNEIILKEFYFVIEVYKCTDDEDAIVDNFIDNYAYGIGVYDTFSKYCFYGKFLRGDVIRSNLIVSLHNILKTELGGGIYLNE